MTAMVSHPATDEPSPPDILELGMALVSATPRLKNSLRVLTTDADSVRRLTEATLREAWYAREHLAGANDVHALLLRILRSNILH